MHRELRKRFQHPASAASYIRVGVLLTVFQCLTQTGTIQKTREAAVGGELSPISSVYNSEDNLTQTFRIVRGKFRAFEKLEAIRFLIPGTKEIRVRFQKGDNGFRVSGLFRPKRLERLAKIGGIGVSH
jgi:hypothetical protein